jgi:TolA-binding protein
MRHRPRLVNPWIVAVVVCLAAAVPAAAQSGRITGVVKNVDTQPVKGATIVAVNETANPHSFTVTTDEKGRFTIVSVQQGLWQLWISAPGYNTEERPVSIAPGRTRPMIDVALTKTAAGPPGALTGISAIDLQTELQAASALLDGGRYDQAIAAYRAILAKAPALTTLNLQIGNGYLLKKDYDRAVAAYREVLAANPGNERAQVALASAYLEKGDLQAAQAALQGPAGQAQGSESLCMLGEIRLAAKDPEEAAVWFRKAAEADPTWTRPVLQLGLIAFDKGDKATALKYLERVIAAAPTSPDAVKAKAIVDQLKK